jgi:hypothetical protein
VTSHQSTCGCGGDGEGGGWAGGGGLSHSGLTTKTGTESGKRELMAMGFSEEEATVALGIFF